MALRFDANSEYISHGSATSLVDIDAPTYIYIGKPIATPNTGARMMFMTANNNIINGEASSGQGSVFYGRARATTASGARCNVNQYATNDLVIFAITDNYTVEAPRMYVGVNGGTIAEVSGYSTQTQGVGAVTASGAAMLWGSRSSVNTFSNWEISYVWVYNRILTLAEIKAHRDPYTVLSGCQLRLQYWDTSTLGLRDWSGKGNHGTINNSPTRANHNPLLHPFDPEWDDDPYVVAAVGGRTTKNTRAWPLGVNVGMNWRGAA